jgi:hypothetical protein
MVRLWRWLKARGRANDKPVAEDVTAGTTVPVQKADPRSKAAAVEQVADNWFEDGDRGDQDEAAQAAQEASRQVRLGLGFPSDFCKSLIRFNDP